MGEASMGLSPIPPPGMFISHSFISEATGVSGNVLAFVLFVSPIPTFRRIMRNKSTEQFSGLPYIYSLMNCFICLWYGMPIVSPGIILVATVNTVGAFFQLTYTTIFIVYADRSNRVKMLGLLFAVFSAFLTVIVVSLKVFDQSGRQLFVGYLSMASLVSMFASPLSVINIVIKTRSVEFMPFYLSLSTFLMSVSFFAYGMLKSDAFIYVPNGIGAVLGVIQLVLYYYYYYYSRREGQDHNDHESATPFLETYVHSD